MTTVQTIMDRARYRLMSSAREKMNVLNGAINNSTTSVTYTDVEEIPLGAVIEIDNEAMLVRVNNTGTKVLTVVRGYRGSTAATHADQALIRTRPIFYAIDSFNEVNKELRDLSSPLNGLYKVSTVDLTFQASIIGYDLTSVTDLIELITVRWENDDKDWPVVHGCELLRNMDTSDFASGFCLRLRGRHDWFPPITGRTMRVFYKAPYTLATAVTDDITSACGLHAEAEDIVELGVMMRVGSFREVTRNLFESQGDSRRAEEVPQGAVTNSFRTTIALRQRRIEAEVARLEARWRTAGK